MGKAHYPPVNAPDTQRFLGMAVLKREGYFTHYDTGEAWRGDLVKQISEIILKRSRFKKINHKLEGDAMKIISILAEEMN